MHNPRRPTLLALSLALTAGCSDGSTADPVDALDGSPYRYVLGFDFDSEKLLGFDPRGRLDGRTTHG